MAWIESHQSLLRHPKTLKLANALSVRPVAAIGHLHCLWWWALDYAPSGDLSPFDDKIIAQAAEWEGDAELFRVSLIQVGFLNDDKTIHDWADYAGKLLERRARNKEAVKKARSQSVITTPSLRNDDAIETKLNVGDTCKATVTNRNQPTVTNRNQPTNRTGPQSGSDLLALFSEEEVTQFRERFKGIDLAWEAGKCFDWHMDKKGRMARGRVSFKSWLEKAAERRKHGITGQDTKTGAPSSADRIRELRDNLRTGAPLL